MLIYNILIYKLKEIETSQLHSKSGVFLLKRDVLEKKALVVL